MKRIIIASTALLLSFSAVNAQEKQGFDHKKGEHFKHGGKGDFGGKLNLTDDQKAQAKTINDDFRKQLSTLRSNDKITMGDFKKQSQALRQDHKQKMDALLTADQKKQLADVKQKGGERHKKMGTARLDEMKTQLGLTDDQVAKLKASQEGVRSKIKAIHDNASLTEEQKREQSKQLMAQQKDSFKAVLTKEQLAKMEGFRKNRDTKK